MELLDVRPMAPAERHSTIFERLDSLGPGESLRLVNDHDPVPLRYQLDATRPEMFSWTPVETGPEEWSVDIVCHARIVDARPIIAGGGEPRAQIMEAANALGEGEVLVVYAPFDPHPLKERLADKGLTNSVAALDDGDFRVTFRRG